jgi:hypothetical protein
VALQQQGASRFRVNSQSLFKVEASELKKNSIHGGHIDPGGLYRRLGLLDYEVEHIDLATGMTRAHVKTTNGVTKTKLMFPTSWSGEVILDQIAQGCCNIDKTIACGDGSFNIECSTNAGLRMQMHVDQSGTIRTCTPLESTATCWATPEEVSLLRSGLKHNRGDHKFTLREKQVDRSLFKRAPEALKKRFELDDSLGGVGETAKCNSWQSWHEASCEIIPGKQSSDKIIVQCNRYRAQFVRECIQKRVRRTHSPTGIAGKYEGIEISWIDVEHVFDQKCDGAKNIVGGHWDRNGYLKKAGVLEVKTLNT